MKAIRTFFTSRTFLLSAIVLVISVAPLAAQRQRMSVDDRVKMMTEQLTLTTKQADSVRAIYTEADKKRSELFNQHQDDRSAMREEMMKVMDDVDKKIEAILTADQKTKYVKMQEERRQQRDSGQHAPKPDSSKSEQGHHE